jgi:hypothetical protein
MYIRFNYYLKNWNIEKTTILIPEHCKIFKQNELYYYQGPSKNEVQDFPYHYGCLYPCFWWDQGSDFSLDIPCLTISADGIDNEKLPALVKVRYIDNNEGGILCPLEYTRHWVEIKNLFQNDIDWNNKLNTCVWRGSPTGIQDYNSLPYEYKNLRMKFCYNYSNIYNIGINCILNHI